MPNWDRVKISSFLQEREDRMTPVEANNMGLKRLEKIDFSGNIHIADGKKTKTNMILVKKGDLVISGINVEKGAITIYKGDEDIVATIHYSSYGYDETLIDIDYLKWFLKSAEFKKALKSQVKGGIKTELKPKKFLPLVVSLPKLSEQKQILDNINSVDSDIQTLKKLIIKAKNSVQALRRAILQEAVQGKLVPQDPTDEPASEIIKRIKAEKEKLIKKNKIKKEKSLPPISENEKPYELPDRWVWVRLGDVVNYGSCSKVEGDNIPDDTWVLDLGDIEKETSKIIQKVNFAERKSKSSKNVFTKGQVLYGKLRPYLDKVVIADEDGICTTEILPLSIYCGITNKYLFWALKRPDFISYVNSKTYGVKMPRLGTTDGRMALLPVPPYEEQTRMTDKIERLLTDSEKLMCKIESSKKNSEKLMQAVLQEAFENG